MDPMIGASLISAGASTGGGLLGMIGAKKREQRQKENQKELMDYQTQNQMRLNQQGHQLQMDMWKATSYPAQVKMMQEAGLNPGLLYGQSGGGGTTAGSQSGGAASGGQAQQGNPLELGAALNAAATASQIALAKSQANKNDAEAESIRGAEGTIGASQIESNLADALNKQSMAALNNIGVEIGNATKEDQIDNAHYSVEKIIKENNLTDNQAELVKVQATATGVRMQLDRANIKVSEEQAKKIANDVILGWKQLDAKLQELQIDNQGNKLRAIEGKTRLQSIQNDFILGTLGKEIDLHKLNVEQQKIFVSLFNGMLSSATTQSMRPY